MPTQQLPADPENMNEQRADAAAKTLAYFTQNMGEKEGGLEQNLSDLLCDLAHFCDRNDLNFNSCLDRARCHYEAETDNEGTQV